MALVKCKECGKEVSNKAESCPGCGKPIKKKEKEGGIGCLLILGFVALMVYVGFSDKGRSEPQSQPQRPIQQPYISQDNAMGCFSKTYYDTLLSFSVRNDSRGIAQLVLEGKCIRLQKGLRVSYIGSDGWGIARIKIYGSEGKSFDVWTAQEFVRR